MCQKKGKGERQKINEYMINRMYMIIVISMIFVIHMIKYTYDKLCDMYYIMIQNTYTEEFNC